MKRITLISITLILTSLQVHAAQNREVCIEQSNGEHPKCLVYSSDVMEIELKRVYEYAINFIKHSGKNMRSADGGKWEENFLKKLEKSQRLWEEYRKAHCYELLEYVGWGGTNIDSSGCMNAHAKERIKVLKMTLVVDKHIANKLSSCAKQKKGRFDLIHFYFLSSSSKYDFARTI